MADFVPTPHIAAKQGGFADTVLMPGDPLRAKYIAETFLESARVVTDIRGIFGYTGYYKGKKVSVMASGMGIPSMGIYSYELYQFYGVQSIIRVGTAGAVQPDIKLSQLVIGTGSCTTSNYAAQYRLPGTFAPIASFDLVLKAVQQAKVQGVPFCVGNLLCTDTFYDDIPMLAEWAKMGVLAVEMESAGLYMNAARTGRKALCICTISDLSLTGESSTPQERQSSFADMIEIALEIAE